MAKTNALNADETKDDIELRAAVELLLKREEDRKRSAERRARDRHREHQRQQAAAVEHMQQSIEIIKWYIVGIGTVMFLGLVIGIWVLVTVKSEVSKVQAEVQKYQPQAERIVTQVTEVVDEVERVRETLRHPMESMGENFGRQLDAKFRSYLGTKDEAE